MFSDKREKVIAYAVKAGFFYHFCDEDPQFGSTYLSDGGLVILSKFPIIATSYSVYSYTHSLEGLVMKGLLYAKINVEPGRNVHVFNTHLASTHWK